MLDKLLIASSLNSLNKANAENIIFSQGENFKISVYKENSQYTISIFDKFSEYEILFRDRNIKIKHINTNNNIRELIIEDDSMKQKFWENLKKINNIIENKNLFIKTNFSFDNKEFSVKIPSKNDLEYNRRLEFSCSYSHLISTFEEINHFLNINREKNTINISFNIKDKDRNINLIDNETFITIKDNTLKIEDTIYDPKNKDCFFSLLTPSDIIDNLDIEIDGIKRNMHYIKKQNDTIRKRRGLF